MSSVASAEQAVIITSSLLAGAGCMTCEVGIESCGDKKKKCCKKYKKKGKTNCKRCPRI